jgi:hypothetical protein
LTVLKLIFVICLSEIEALDEIGKCPRTAGLQLFRD